MKAPHQRTVFFTIVAAQFCGTSLWFAGNAVLPQLQAAYHWPTSALGWVTSSTQFGFIVGTMAFSAGGLADRFSPSKVFFASSFIAALANVVVLIAIENYTLVIASRFLVGFFLAGIYPVGMKIASDWKEEGLGHWLGALVGALVVGTAFPHGLKLVPQFVKPPILLIAISLLAVVGAVVLLILVPDGPYRKVSTRFSLAGVGRSFRLPSFRAPALGYFGHMWELYAFWAFVPWIFSHYRTFHAMEASTSLLSFIVIGLGAIGCVAGGYWSLRWGSASVARMALLGSGLCCLISPLLWSFDAPIFISFMIIWGIFVISDSPQFSALVARNAPESFRGSAITLVTCIGFSITIVSIQLLTFLSNIIPPEYLLLLLTPGPVLGLISMHSPATRTIPTSKEASTSAQE